LVERVDTVSGVRVIAMNGWFADLVIELDVESLVYRAARKGWVADIADVVESGVKHRGGCKDGMGIKKHQTRKRAKKREGGEERMCTCDTG
jgi:hypothetical protein